MLIFGEIYAQSIIAFPKSIITYIKLSLEIIDKGQSGQKYNNIFQLKGIVDTLNHYLHKDEHYYYCS